MPSHPLAHFGARLVVRAQLDERRGLNQRTAQFAYTHHARFVERYELDRQRRPRPAAYFRRHLPPECGIGQWRIDADLAAVHDGVKRQDRRAMMPA